MRLRLRESGPEGYFNSFPLNAAMDEILTVGEVVESRAEGFSPATRSRRVGLARLLGGQGGRFSLGGVGTLRRLDVDRPGRQVPRPGGQHSLDGLRRPRRRRAGEGGRRHLGLGGRRRRRLAVQIAKLRGLTVIRVRGSPDKVRFLLDKLGIDAAFDYHDGRSSTACARRRPTGSTSTSTWWAATTSRPR